MSGLGYNNLSFLFLCLCRACVIVLTARSLRVCPAPFCLSHCSYRFPLPLLFGPFNPLHFSVLCQTVLHV